jgi:hypothetical protein
MIDAVNNEEAKGRGVSPAIAIFAYGRRGYAQAAENLALTLCEHSPNVPVHLWAGEGLRVDHALFTKVHQLDSAWYAQGPGTLKVSVYEILPKGEWLVMDADSLVIADITTHLDALSKHDFAIEVKGKGGEHDTIEYTPWATNATIKRVCELKSDATYYGVQSSWMWIRKPSKKAGQIFKIASQIVYQHSDLKEPWGNDIPDELRLASALSCLNIDLPDHRMSFYGQGHEYKGLHDVAKHLPIVCLYGDLRQHRLIKLTWFESYDRYVRGLYRKHGIQMWYNLHSVMQDKYVNRK